MSKVRFFNPIKHSGRLSAFRGGALLANNNAGRKSVFTYLLRHNLWISANLFLFLGQLPQYPFGESFSVEDSLAPEKEILVEIDIGTIQVGSLPTSTCLRVVLL